jgi:hypothetical protein
MRVMADLFQTLAPKQESYTEKDIEVLEGLEPVRRRPGMYIGGTDERAMHHLVAELLDNAMDEAVAGHATRIELELAAGNQVTVRDNGRGIPVGRHKKFKDKSAVEVILTTLHSGAKFSQKTYATSGGLHGVGLSVVNASPSARTRRSSARPGSSRPGSTAWRAPRPICSAGWRSAGPARPRCSPPARRRRSPTTCISPTACATSWRPA